MSISRQSCSVFLLPGCLIALFTSPVPPCTPNPLSQHLLLLHVLEMTNEDSFGAEVTSPLLSDLWSQFSSSFSSSHTGHNNRSLMFDGIYVSAHIFLQQATNYKKALLLLNALCYLATTDKESDIFVKFGCFGVIPISFFLFFMLIVNISKTLQCKMKVTLLYGRVSISLFCFRALRFTRVM